MPPSVKLVNMVGNFAEATMLAHDGKLKLKYKLMHRAMEKLLRIRTYECILVPDKNNAQLFL